MFPTANSAEILLGIKLQTSNIPGEDETEAIQEQILILNNFVTPAQNIAHLYPILVFSGHHWLDDTSGPQVNCARRPSLGNEQGSWLLGYNVCIRPNITFKVGVHPAPYSPRIPVVHPRPIYHLFLQRVIKALTGRSLSGRELKDQIDVHSLLLNFSACHDYDFHSYPLAYQLPAIPSPTPRFRFPVPRTGAQVLFYSAQFERCSRAAGSVELDVEVATTASRVIPSSLSALVEQVRLGIDGILESDDTAKGKTANGDTQSQPSTHATLTFPKSSLH
ncbi:hypothetical protein GYMLUDRAFT_252374 [Collybiopsis luxurians FD-317 M1]|uniref:Unplaced genomic scaffold GYMLUscaffold_125, whole genome shotgun sequence n=1 Tax=Collybiopsis luxurians FD-317 M1 TaxID=944289 RepID=A0A0D0C8K4_9AGAR|nr:hypothetical protein GYMLUDRAFT_252374 [Collybiopsis luxurians FD-317 M1]